MATFARSSYSHASYANFRPAYPRTLYDTIFAFHRGPRILCVDLGCGHGVVTRALAPHFARVLGTDPSNGMVTQARLATSSTDFPNIEYREAQAEQLTDVEDESVDMVVAGQAAHWFDYPHLWPEMKRVLRAGGTLAFWGYTDHVFVGYPKASELLRRCTYGEDKEDLGPYWSFPGRSIVEGKLRDIRPPEDWKDITRIEYEPSTKGPHLGKGTMFLSKQISVAECKGFVRTWSAYHGWQQAHAGQTSRAEGGQGDVVDLLFDEMAEAEGWKGGDEQIVDIEWGTGLLMARRG